MKRILITGAAGFLGSHLCDRFIREGYHVIGMDNLITGDKKNIEHLFGLEHFEFLFHDVSKFVHVPGPLDYILHFASPASPIDYLKIDKSFINELATSGDSRLLLAILAIAKTMGLSSIVEGVETREQVDFLRSAGCDIIQGYYINRALVIDEVIKLYKNNGEYL